jgi:hypothetical protein
MDKRGESLSTESSLKAQDTKKLLFISTLIFLLLIIVVFSYAYLSSESGQRSVAEYLASVKNLRQNLFQIFFFIVIKIISFFDQINQLN